MAMTASKLHGISICIFGFSLYFSDHKNHLQSPQRHFLNAFTVGIRYQYVFAKILNVTFCAISRT